MRFRDKTHLLDYINICRINYEMTWMMVSLFEKWNTNEELRNVILGNLTSLRIQERNGRKKAEFKKETFESVMSDDADKILRNFLRTNMIGSLIPAKEAIDDYCEDTCQKSVWQNRDNRFYQFVRHVRNALTHDLRIRWRYRSEFPKGEWNGIIIDKSMLGKSVSKIITPTMLHSLIVALNKWVEDNLS